MNLYVDVGNSRIKWIQDGTPVTGVADSLDMLSLQWRKIGAEHVERVVGGCVRGKQIAMHIDQLARTCFNVSPQWLSSTTEACGVRNAYVQSAHLGIDRWAVLIAARARYPQQDCIIVDAGTAITIDLLEESGQHGGGVIMPGAKTMFDSLGRAEQLYPGAAENVVPLTSSVDVLANTTHDALIAGVFFAIQGGVRAVITQQALQISAKIETLPIILTGGDSGMIKLDPLQAIPVPDLVLEGLKRLAEH